MPLPVCDLMKQLRLFLSTVLLSAVGRVGALSHPRLLAAECVAGFVGGAAKQLCVHPLETIATLSEIRRGKNPAPVPWRELASRPQRLYAGFLLTASLNAPYALVFHATMYCSSLGLATFSLPPPVIELLAGALAAAVACIVGVPLETIKHRMMVSGKGYETMGSAVARALRSPREHYAGFYTTLLRNIPYNSVQFGAFALFSGIMPKMYAGALAGVATAVVTTPIDVVNTRLQTQAVVVNAGGGGESSTCSGAADLEERIYSGPIDAARSMALDEGLGSFWRGSFPRAVSYAPSALIFFSVFGGTRQYLASVWSSGLYLG